MIRVTGGNARGRVLRERVPVGVRPTAGRVREAIFDLVGHDQDGRRILDAFGGAGLVGIEAWSRGASVVVVERDRRIAASISRRGEEIGAAWTVRVGDVVRLAAMLGQFDGIFVDPPYGDDPAAALAVLAPLAREWLVLESPADRAASETVGRLSLERSRSYGDSALHVYRPTG